MKKIHILIVLTGLLGFIVGAIYITKKYSKPPHLKAAATIFQELMPQTTIETVTPLTGGASGSGIYKIDTQDHTYILRILTKNRSQKSITRELGLTELMGKLGVSPTVYAISLKNNALVMQEIKGQALWGPHLLPDEMKDLARKLSLIHQPHPTITPNYATPRHIAAMILKDLHYDVPLVFKEAFDAHAPNFNILENKNYVLSHTDLNPGNILKDTDTGSLKIIDWEDAYWTHPYLDIVTMFMFYNVKPQEKSMFLEAYENNAATGIDQKELNAAYKIQNFIHALRLLRTSYLLPPQGESPSDFQVTIIKPLFKEKKFTEIISLFNKNAAYAKNVTYAMALLRLEESFQDLQ